MATLSVHGLERRFGDEIVALDDVSLTVEDGRVAAILGPSGCGKTTLLRLIAGLERPDGGDILIDGESILGLPPHRRRLGLMFQELALFPHLSVAGNIEFGLRMQRQGRAQRGERVRELLAAIGLPSLGDRRVHELSGGERQRVALARTLAPQPAVLLLDEPLGSLDESLKLDLRAHIRAVLQRLHTTALIVSHDLRDAVALADDLVVMERGRVLQDGPIAAVMAQPATTTVARLLGYVTLAAGAVEGGHVSEREAGTIALPPGASGWRSGAVLAHPTSLLAVPEDRGLGCGAGGPVVAHRPEGTAHLVEVALGKRAATVRWEWDLAPPPAGTRVEIAARPETLRFFDGEGAALAGAPLPAQRSDAPWAHATFGPPRQISSAGDDEAPAEGAGRTASS